MWDKDDKHLWQYPDANEVNPQLRMIAKWNPAGDMLAVGSQDGKIRLLDRDGKLRVWTSDGQLEWIGFMLPDDTPVSIRGFCFWCV